jgi:hypothetical protein
MSMRIFLSSTREDLNPDCRPSVLTGVKIGEAELVEMDSWDTPHEDPVGVCRRKIRDDSSHYLGLFAYRRGWVPPMLQKSITEAEYEWALEYRKPANMVVFLPLAGSELDLKLRERAKTQPLADAEAQKAFLNRVRRLAFQPFENPQELSSKVTRKLLSWKGGGLRAMAATPASKNSSRRRPSEEDIFALGRRKHLTHVEETLELLLGRSPPRVGVFLIHGPRAHGHEALAARVKNLVGKTSTATPRVLLFPLNVPWFGRSVDALVARLARELDVEAANAAELAPHLEADLETKDVILEIRGTQDFDGSLLNLIKGFWQPMVEALRRPVPHQFIGLLTHFGEVPAEWDAWMQPPPAPDDEAAFDPAQVIRLPRLEPFTQSEIAFWLGSWFDQPQMVAQYLMAETRGHPGELFNCLKDDALWIS